MLLLTSLRLDMYDKIRNYQWMMTLLYLLTIEILTSQN